MVQLEAKLTKHNVENELSVQNQGKNTTFELVRGTLLDFLESVLDVVATALQEVRAQEVGVDVAAVRARRRKETQKVSKSYLGCTNLILSLAFIPPRNPRIGLGNCSCETKNNCSSERKIDLFGCF